MAPILALGAGLVRLTNACREPLAAGGSVAVVVVGASGLVFLANGLKDDCDNQSWSGPLKPVAFQGRLASEWADEFDIRDEPAVLVRSLQRGAEVHARQFVMAGGVLVDVSVLRASALSACGETQFRRDGDWSRSLCPARVTISVPSGRGRQLRTTACLPPTDTTARVIASIEPQTGAVTIDTLIDGSPEPSCHRSLHLPQTDG